MFLKIAESISAKQAFVKTTAIRVITQWVLLGLATFLWTLLANYLLYPLLACHGLGLLVMMGVAGAGAGAVFLVILMMSNAMTSLSLEANLSEIRTLLKFNTVARAMATYGSPNTSFVTKKRS